MLSRKLVSIPRREGTDVCHHPRCQSPSYPITNIQYPIPSFRSNQTALSVSHALFPFYLSVLYLFSYRDPCPEVLLRITFPVFPSLLGNITLPNLIFHKILPSLWKRNAHRNLRPFLAWYVIPKIVST